MSPAPHPSDPRRVAVAVWAGQLVLLGLFVVLATALPSPVTFSAPRELVLWVAIVTSAAGIALSRTLPARIGARQAGGRPHTLAMTRFILCCGLCGACALLPLVAHVLQRDGRLLGVFAVDVLALVLLFPSADHWAELAKIPERPRERGRAA
ncbi:MAG TPA: hypothetical protein VFP65_21910 [Anaeromyxobacteraceae bacterium]|nr:hypothetical protein [Anaeromyxobacteraceae bacterium]